MQTKTDPVGDELAAQLERLGTARIGALTEAERIQTALHSLLQHEVRRIRTKLGPDHPRTGGLDARLQSNLSRINALSVERERYQVKVPDVAEDDVLIHGRVVDEDSRGITGLMVCLVDLKGTPVSGSTEPITDVSGYFAITLDAKLVDKLSRVHQDDLFLAVFTAKRRLVHRQPKPLTVVKGVRLLEEIRLNRGELLGGVSVPTPAPAPKIVVVPKLIGMPEVEALKRLAESSLKLGERSTEPVPDQVGLVLDQNPKAGSEVFIGTAVELVIGIAEPVRVPKVVGLKLSSARRKIKRNSLTVGTVKKQKSESVGVVLEQDPEVEKEVPAGTAISLVVGR